MSRVSQLYNPGTIYGQEKGEAPEYTLAGVLRFLQTEWRNAERERNEWEIERAEMKSKLAILEGEKRANERTHIDLLRRIKMLEFSLRQEREKFLSGKAQDSEKRGSPLSPIGPSNFNNAKHALQMKGQMNTSSIISLKNRARKDKCKEILKLCLEELNVMPNKPTTTNGPQSPGAPDGRVGLTSYLEPSLLEEFSKKNLAARAKTLNFGNRPRLSVEINGETPLEYVSSPLPPEILKRPTATTALTVSASERAAAAAAAAADEADDKVTPRVKSTSMTSKEEKRKKRITIIIPEGYNGEILDDMGHIKGQDAQKADATGAGKSDASLPNDESFSKDMNESLSTATSGKLSSIFKALGKKSEDSEDTIDGSSNPDALLLSTKPSQDSMDRSNNFTETSFSFDGEKSLSLEGNGNKKAPDMSQILTWKPKLTLKSHLDSVRSIDFHKKDLIMASGSQDGTVKLWNLSSLSTLTKKSARQEHEPSFVYRGHRGPVTCVTIDSDRLLAYSSSFDFTIKAWKFPSESRRMQDSIEPHLLQSTFSGHKDIVWNIRIQPDNELLASCSADGTSKLWNTDPASRRPLKSSFTLDSILGTSTQSSGKNHQSVPVAVDFCPRDPGKLLVGYRNSVIHLVDIETGRSVVKFQSNQTYDETPSTQLNCFVTHSSLPLVISGHEDRFIRLFDINTGECSHSMVAHVGPISSLDINAAGTSLVSGAHDASIRWWDLANNSCVQEFSSHMSKSSESVFGVKFHPRYPWLASCGADSIIKLFSV